MDNPKVKKLILVALAVISFTVFILVFVDLGDLKPGEGLLPNKPSKVGNQLIKDSGNIFSLEVPADWRVFYYQAHDDFVAGAETRTNDFKLTSAHQDQAGTVFPSTIESGMIFSISVFKGALDEKDMPDQSSLTQKDIVVDGVKADYYIYPSKDIMSAEIHEVRFDYGGKVYFLKMVFNPETIKNGSAIFNSIYNSLRISKTI